MLLKIFVNKVLLVALMTPFLTHCLRSQPPSSSSVQGQSSKINPKMDVLRSLVQDKFQSPTNVSGKNATWNVQLTSSNDSCSRARLRLAINSSDDPKKGAEIYINFVKDRKDFYIMVDWAADRESLIFYAPPNDDELEKMINRQDFLDAVRLIIAGANASKHDGLGMIASYLLTWYAEDKQSTLFEQGLQLAYVSDGSIKEKYVGKTKEGKTCEVTVSKDQSGNIFSVTGDMEGIKKDRFFWFNLIPGSQTAVDSACLLDNTFVNTHAVVDGKRKAQWTFAEASNGMRHIFRTSFKGSTDKQGQEILKIQQIAGSYSSTVIGVANAPVTKSQVKLCMNNGRIERARIVKKGVAIANVSLVVPVPLLGVSVAAKFKAECENLNLEWSLPIVKKSQ